MTLSAYELKRLENIRQNQKILAALEIPKVSETAAPKNSAQEHKVPAAASSGRKRPAPAPAAAAPSRLSARLRAKMEEEKTGMRYDGEVLLRELPEPVVKPAKPRSRPGSKIPFSPEEGATEGFLSLMKLAQAPSHPQHNNINTGIFPAKMGIRSAGGVVKVCQDRIYSAVLHPGREKIIAATGSKSGQIAFWDATAIYHNHDTTFTPPSSPATPYYLFHPHSGSVSALRYNPANCSQLLSSGYEGSLQCMDISKGHFETIYAAPPDEEQYISSFDFFGADGNVLAFSDMSGYLSTLDRRSNHGEKFHLHVKKIGGMSISPVNPDLIATCSLDNVVCVWDRRAMKPEGSVPLSRFEYRRAVTAVSFHPAIQDCLVSTCYDDHVRIHRNVLAESPTEIAVRHNNQTGRWITTFKAIWDPKSTAESGRVIVGDMNRGIDVIDGSSGVTHNYTSEHLTAQPAVNAAHPSLDLIVSGNASGKLALWTPF